MSSRATPRALLRAWQVAAVVGLGAFTLHAAVGLGGPGSDHFFNRWLYCGLLALASGACLVRAVTVRAERLAWLFLAAGLIFWTVGDTYYTFAFAGLDSPPFPSVADAFYLGFYAMAYVALVLLVRSRVPEFNRAVWLDGVLATLAAAALGATVLVEAVLRTTEGTVAVVVTNLAYPIGDTLLLALTLGVFALTGWRPGRYWAFIGAGFVACAVADGIFLYQIAAGTYREGTLLDALWPASMLLLAQAAWQRPARQSLIQLEGRRALATPAVCGLVGIGVLAYGHFHHVNLFAVALAVGTLLAVIVRTGITFEENQRITSRIRRQAVTDALTGLGNRRSLLSDLGEALSSSVSGQSILIIFDLDGFKRYNDSFGHPAGDALLVRLGGKLAASVGDEGRSYRLGGDEFCVLAPVPEGGVEPLLDATVAALSERGEGFSVGTSFGAVFIPDEARESAEALGIADQRLYAQKHGKESNRGQTHDVLLQAMYERRPELQERVLAGADLSLSVAERMGAAPALLEIAKIVRSTHERWDGLGYPDGLAGEAIPLGSRIISACDAFVAMTSDRPHRARRSDREALDELRHNAGTQFDPAAAAMLCDILAPVRVKTEAA